MAQELSQAEQELLKQGSLVREWLAHPAWLTVVKPYLQARLHNSWVDPREVKEEDFKWQYLNAYHFAKAIQELIDTLEKWSQEAEGLRKKEQGDIEKSPRIGQ